MIRAIVIVAVAVAGALTLAGCGTTRTKTVYVPVTVPATFYDPTTCVWPDRDQVIVAGTDLELADYILKGFEAWSCERTLRLGAGERQAEIARDVGRR